MYKKKNTTLADRWATDDIDPVVVRFDEYLRDKYSRETPIKSAIRRVEKHYTGQHDQSKHGYRFGSTPSLSRARQLKKDGNWDDYVARARARQGEAPQKDTPTPKPKPSSSPVQSDSIGNIVGEKKITGSKSEVSLVTTESGEKFIKKPINKIAYEAGDLFDATETNGAVFDVAAHNLSESLELGVVPKARIVNGDFYSNYMDGETLLESLSGFNPRESKKQYNDIASIVAIDIVLGNSDSHHGQVVIGKDGRIYGVDFNQSGSSNSYPSLFEELRVYGGKYNGQYRFPDSVVSKLQGRPSYDPAVPAPLQKMISSRTSNLLSQLKKGDDGDWYTTNDIWGG